MRECRLRWRGGATALSERSSLECSSTRSSSCWGESTRRRAAASSRASGMPSSRAQSAATAALLSASSRKSGATAWARSVNSTTASYWGRTAAGGGLSAVGAASGRTGIKCSPAMSSACLLVASTLRAGHSRSSVSTSTAHACRSCSQLSSNTRTLRSASCLASADGAHWRERLCRCSAPATVDATRASSCTAERSTNHTPSEKARRTSAATLSASRVLPTPPVPTRVTRRDWPKACFTAAFSLLRPTKLVSAAGRLSAASLATGLILRWTRPCSRGASSPARPFLTHKGGERQKTARGADESARSEGALCGERTPVHVEGDAHRACLQRGTPDRHPRAARKPGQGPPGHCGRGAEPVRQLGGGDVESEQVPVQQQVDHRGDRCPLDRQVLRG